MKIELYDTTLRDGAQGAGVSFNEGDRLRVIHALDELGINYIEAGNFAIGSNDWEIFRRAGEIGAELKNARLVAFGSTRRAGERAFDDAALRAIAKSDVPVVAVFGKSWLSQVEEVLHTTREENLAMIADTVRFLKGAGKEVIFDAEHFFDGYSDNPIYALEVLATAHAAGADTLVLCDTNGGILPDIVGMTVTAVRSHLTDAKLGIHCHNDMGMAVACTLSGVLSGAAQIQGTISGIGERCGNANLCTLIPLLQLKLGFGCVSDAQLSSLTAAARTINEIANLDFDEREPFVGGYAFTHKAGMHIDAVQKNPGSFEHIVPERVGNSRNLLISALAGRAALREKMQNVLPGLTKDSPQVAAVLAHVKAAEGRGYQYEDAEASLMLLIYEVLGLRRELFTVETFKVMVGEPYTRGRGAAAEGSSCTAMIKITVDGAEEITAAEGCGPVNALDLALRRALTRFFPAINRVRLTDYKVRVSGSDSATASVVRVFIESTDGTRVWRTVGVSADIIDASWQALLDSVEFYLLSEELGALPQTSPKGTF
ncbi:MAG: citramalate synthase [Clostridia bacterium]|nr:citramalate synthase [Clostridia bacterium]